MKFFNWLFKLIFKKNEFLCDTCKYDYRGACDDPKRPNVKECPSYKKR